MYPSGLSAEDVPFALYGLSEAFRGPRALNGVGRTGDVINQVTLSHGRRNRPPDAWVEVTVLGPLHGRGPGTEWWIDPLPMLANELLNHAGAQLSTREVLERAVQDVLDRPFDEHPIRVDGESWPFRLVYERDHWLAIHDLQPDHMLCIVASNVEPEDIELRPLDDLSSYYM